MSAPSTLESPSTPLPLSGSYREILTLTGPLILSSTGFMLMHFVDAVFLARHSEEAIAVAGPSGMAAFVLMGFFSGVASYTSTFVAQYVGAGRPERVGPAVWQGMYFALVAGIVLALLATQVSQPLFDWVGHDPGLRRLEAQYFEIMLWGAPLGLIGAAVAGFYSGRGDNMTLMMVQLAGFALNAVLSYGLIFGAWGLPNWGPAGAAAATATAQGFNTIVLMVIYFSPNHRRRFNTWSSRALDLPLFRRMLYYGSFSGLRFTTEIFAWTLFLFFVGRLDKTDLAVTNIAWRINGFAFFPLLGLSTAISTLVGQAQGSENPDRAEKVTWRGVVLAEGWMLFASAVFLIFPRHIIRIFADEQAIAPEHFAQMMEIGVVLLRFVALYCLLDGLNYVFLGALQGAGDTRWTLIAAAVLHAVFLAALIIADQQHASLNTFWTIATTFVMVQAVVWCFRFRQGHWRHMRVIEPSVAV